MTPTSWRRAAACSVATGTWLQLSQDSVHSACMPKHSLGDLRLAPCRLESGCTDMPWPPHGITPHCICRAQDEMMYEGLPLAECADVGTMAAHAAGRDAATASDSGVSDQARALRVPLTPSRHPLLQCCEGSLGSYDNMLESVRAWKHERVAHDAA
jgi:hypothetical protein